MDIIEAKTTWGKWLKVLLLCVIGLSPLVPLLLLLGYRRLRNIPEDDPNYKFLKWVLIAGVAVLVAIGLYLVHYFTQTREGENELFVEWLPPTAANVSFHRTFYVDAHEFDISEEHFLELFKQRAGLKEIESEFVIDRYAKYYTDSRPEDQHTALVRNGLYMDWEVKHWIAGTRVFKVVYDRDKKRAYFFTQKIVEE